MSNTEPAIRNMVDTFYGRVRNDPVLAPVFERMLKDRWDEHMPRMYAFWTRVLRGHGEFQGNVFGTHMALHDIEPEHFVNWLGLFRQTVAETLDADDAELAILTAERIAGSLQYGYFGQRVV